MAHRPSPPVTRYGNRPGRPRRGAVAIRGERQALPGRLRGPEEVPREAASMVAGPFGSSKKVEENMEMTWK